MTSSIYGQRDCDLLYSKLVKETYLRIIEASRSVGFRNSWMVCSVFCSDNMMIVDEVKTKVMVYGPANRNVVFKFNGKTLDIVDQYKYLGNITKIIKTWNGDMFGANYQYLCNKARQAFFALFKRLKTLGILPVKVMMYLFRSLVRPILTYGSDVWGVHFIDG